MLAGKFFLGMHDSGSDGIDTEQDQHEKSRDDAGQKQMIYPGFRYDAIENERQAWREEQPQAA